jgi:2-amino-4-hydroxy-6-hydroxymethyldihydropteridine diphosphokinase
MSPSNPAGTAETAYLGLGSNLGDRAAALAGALAALRARPGIEVTRVSSLYATDPVGPVPQGEFLNAAAEVRTRLGPRELLAACLEIEAGLGRLRTERWGPRAIDLDLLLFGELRMEEPDLVLPHPRMRERAFVLAPLAEIAPARLLEGRTLAAWAAAAGGAGVRRLAMGIP